MQKDLNLIKLVPLADDAAEFIPILTTDDEEKMNNEIVPDELAILPLRNMVLFPGVVIPITVGRDKSIRLVQDAYNGNKIIGVVAQVDHKVDDPHSEQLHKVGTAARLIKILKMPDGNTMAIIQGKRRFKTRDIIQHDPYLKARVEPLEESKPLVKDPKFEALIASLKDLAINIIVKNPNIPSEASIAIKNIDSPSFLINFISSNLNVESVEKQKILEVNDLVEKGNLLLGYLTKELQMLELKNEMQSKVRTDLDKQQREYFLNQQMKMIQEELGTGASQEIKELKEKAEKKLWSKEVKETFFKELEKLQKMHPSGPEHSIQMNYLQVLIELPWNEYTQDSFDLKNAQKILDRDHFGLEKVKDRVLEHLAVLKLKANMKAPILCLYGPPGVGKTSLGKSIAEALGRKYVRMSLGGLRDEAEIRGHRKTYIGAMPGRIIQSMKKAKSSNPVFVLDEIDKVGNDFRGDPSSALLEVLDPEQNNTFYDNFVEIDYDLSKVLFIATANSLSTVQPALRDRLEIIEMTGYTVEEKIEIAKRHLLPKQIAEHGLKPKNVKLTDEILEAIIENYTRESGVRQLDKLIAKAVRQRAKSIAIDEKFSPEVKLSELQKLLGPGHSKDKYQGNDVVGVVTGLAFTTVGGDILFVESSLSKGKGKLALTGNLGEVMKESAMIALQYLRAHSSQLGLDEEVFEKHNVHIHVPEGATPKDGPSAGITMLTALASSFTNRKVKPYIAMTGEITLRGRVLPVGGIKEKILAAKRAGIKEVILSEDNKKDVGEIPERYLTGLEFHYVQTMIEVVEMALEKVPVEGKLPVAV